MSYQCTRLTNGPNPLTPLHNSRHILYPAVKTRCNHGQSVRIDNDGVSGSGSALLQMIHSTYPVMSICIREKELVQPTLGATATIMFHGIYLARHQVGCSHHTFEGLTMFSTLSDSYVYTRRQRRMNVNSVGISSLSI